MESRAAGCFKVYIALALLNQMGRCSKLLMVGLNVFLTGAMP